MNRLTRRAHVALALSLAASGAGAQAPSTTANTKVVTRQLAAATATSPEILGSVAAMRELPNGNVLVNDQARHKVLLLDKDLKLVSIVADSTSNTGNAYGVQAGGLLPFRGDSTLFVDPASLSMLVIDPNGKIIRTMAAPRPNDIRFLTGGALGNPGFDANGRLVYRTLDFGFGRGGRGPQPGQPFTMPTPPDSAALVRFDLTTRKLDTAGFFKLAKTYMNMTQDDNGRMNVSVQINPLPVVDDWAVMSDGTIAFIRGRDYHVDFVGANGVVTRGDKVAYDWQRMNDDDKQAFLDSSKVALEKARAAGPQALAATAGGNGGDPLGGGNAMAQAFGFGGLGGGRGDGGIRVQIGGGDGGGPGRGGPGGPGGGNGPQVALNMVPPSELPDYKPVFAQGAVRADMDDRLWVRTIATKVTTGGAIYEVLDRAGKLVDRVQIPAGRAIAGFGKGGVVYLGYRDADGIHIQKAVLK
ncbi:MAG: hypothetical protein JWM95_1577 [Gemmatimonadetes bacterium]|nr:hypothetical protein [Gemmatimonadota bacterium]